MATKTSTGRLYLFVITLLHVSVSWSFLDFDELSSIHYGIDILDVPVVLGKEPTAGQVLLRNKYGQQYQCGYPEKTDSKKKSKEEEKVAEETGVPDLLRPMENGPCLVLTKDWWTYEFCYGKMIKQYHLEDGKVVGSVSILGVFQSEFDWSSEEAKVNRNNKKKELIRYHSQQYVNGTLCDLTGNTRKVEVRFHCESGVGDYISRIDEPETCVYIMTVHTMKICHHPYLKPLYPNKPIPISCNPVLSHDEYQEYLEDQKAEEEAREEARRLKHLEKVKAMREYREKMEKEGKMVDGIPIAQSEEDSADSDVLLDNDSTEAEETEEEAGQSSPQIDANNDYQSENELDISVTELEKLMVNSLSKGLKDLVNNKDGDNQDVKVNLKVIKDPKELRKYMNQVLKEEKNDKSANQDEDTVDKEQDDITDPDTTLPTNTDTDTKSDTEMGSDSVETVGLDETKSQQHESHLDESQTTVEQEFEKTNAHTDNDALDEFQKGLEKMDNSKVSNAHNLKENIRSAMQSKFNDIVKEAEEEMQREGVDQAVDKPAAYKTLAKTLNKLLKKLDDTNSDLRKMDEQLKDKLNRAKSRLKSSESPEEGTAVLESDKDTETNPETEEVSKTKSETKLGNVKLRVTRVKHKTKSEGEDDSVTGQNTLHISPDQKQKLETSVRSELEKAGMDTQGRKIEVKIVTAGYYDKDDDTLHTLSEHDSAAFNRMVLTILGKSQETAKAIEKQQRMESNYKLLWKSRKKKKVPTATLR